MKTHARFTHLVLLTATACLLGATSAHAGRGGRCYGVSASSAGRGTVYTGSRGGSAYVGPRGAAVQGPDGRTAAAGQYGGAAYAGPNGAAVAGRYGGAAAVGANGVAVAGAGGVAVAGGGAAVATRAAVRRYPVGYSTLMLPVGYRAVIVNGYTYYCADGTYYSAQFVNGTTVYVVVDM